MKSLKKIIIVVLILAILGVVVYCSLGKEWFARLYGEEQTVVTENVSE